MNTCEIEYRSYQSPDQDDAAIITDTAACTSLTMQNKIGYAKVDTTGTLPTFIFPSQETVPVGQYYVCWCGAASSQCSDPSTDDEMAMFSLNIGNLTRAPPMSDVALDCSAGTCISSSTYSLAADMDSAQIIEGDDCHSITANVVAGPVRVRNSSFIPEFYFSISNTLSQSTGLVCWCNNCRVFDDFSTNSIDIQRVRFAQGPALTNFVCRFGTAECNLEYDATSYPSPSAMDAVIVIPESVGCAGVMDLDSVVGFAVVDVDTFSFNLTPDQNMIPVGTFVACYCNGEETDSDGNVKSCVMPTTVEAANNFSIPSGIIIRGPAMNTEPLICTGTTCTAMLNYDGAMSSDSALISRSGSCDGLVESNIVSEPVEVMTTESDNQFTFDKFTNPKPVLGLLCWCPNCFATPPVLSSYIVDIVPLQLDAPPPPQNTFICVFGIVCNLTYTTYVNDQNPMDAIVVTTKGQCGDMSGTVQATATAVYTNSNPTFTLSSSVKLPTDVDLSICWCYGGDGSKSCANPTSAMSFNIEIGTVRQIDPVYMPPKDKNIVCVSSGEATPASCGITYSSYPDYSPNDVAILIRKNAACGDNTAVIALAEVSGSQSVPQFLFSLISVPVGEYLVCFCRGNDLNKECIQSEPNEFNSPIGEFKYYPMELEQTVECAVNTPCTIQLSELQYPLPSADDRCLIIPSTATCDNITESAQNLAYRSNNVVSEGGIHKFIFTPTQGGQTFNVCWCDGRTNTCGLPPDVTGYKAQIAKVSTDATSSAYGMKFSVSMLIAVMAVPYLMP
eukprot:GHVL01029468.1.p1 GENE.GHVL01029468.1~~GHVL01029468.1.p1  ORF type:complete len:787 (+),score=103.77 GHVL01029468.1:345-2705(+)